MSYKPNAKPEDSLDEMTPTGWRTRDLVCLEESAQEHVAMADNWRLAVALEYRSGKDSKPVLESLGFQILDKIALFYEVIPPQGWTKSTEGYWTTVKDETDHTRFMQFYKAAIYDNDAFLSILDL
jgi:hypothetical protein